MTAARAPRPEVEVGCVLAREIGVLVVLTDDGPVRASYGARMLGAIARDRSRSPEAGEWVTAAPLVRRTRDRRGRPHPAAALATVLPLHRTAAQEPGGSRDQPWTAALRVAAGHRTTRVRCFSRGKRDPPDARVPGGRRPVPAGRLPRGIGRRTGHSRPHDRSGGQLRPQTSPGCASRARPSRTRRASTTTGRLCGTLRRTPNSKLPREGDGFRFVSVRTSGEVNGKTEQQVVIYGDVVD